MPAKEQSIQLPTSLFKGLVLNPAIVNRDFNSAQVCLNFLKKDNGQGTIRPGTTMRYMADVNTLKHEVMYPFTYFYHDTTTGATKELLLALSMGMNASFVKQTVKLYLISAASLVISYSGTGNGTIDVVVDPNNSKRWNVTVKSNGVTDTTFTSKAATDNSAGQLSSFVSNIHALSNFNCSPTSISSSANATPIDFVPKSISIASGGTETIEYFTRTLIDTGVDAPKVFTDADFILPCALNFSNVIYFAYGSYEMKYDGLDFYRSGLPQGTVDSIVESGSGTTFHTGEVYIYKIVHLRYDAKGNIIEGEDSDDTLAEFTITVAAANTDIIVGIDSLRATTFPNYAIKGAKVNGAQAGVNTITVDNPHTLEIGDTAYLYDGVSSSYVTRSVTGIAAATVTINGAAVTVADNAYISNNVRTQIWRTKNGGTDFYFVNEIPNNALSDDNNYTDSTPDTSLTEPFVEQLRKHSLPPKCSYLGEHQGLKISAGDPDYPNRISWALPDAPEGYPLESNNFDVKGAGKGALTGFGTEDDEDLVVFKEFGHGHIKGTLDDLSISFKDKANTGIGCTSFRSLAYIGDDDALCGLSRKGVFIFNNGVPSLALGNSINPLIPRIQTPQVNGTNIGGASYATALVSQNAYLELVLKRAVAINDSISGQYHLYIPAETGEPSENVYPYYVSAKYLVYDYNSEIPYWTEYGFYNYLTGAYTGSIDRNVQPNAGFALYNNRVWFGMADYDGDLGGTAASLFNFNEEDDADGYVDSTYPVYLDIQYTPFTRNIGSASAFFKALYVTLQKFLDDRAAEPRFTNDLGSNFKFRIKLIKDYKNYALTGNPAKPTYITNAPKTFNVSNGQTVVPVKCNTDKCRALQINLTNQDVELGETEQIIFDQIDLVYSTPYDPKMKDPKGTNG